MANNILAEITEIKRILAHLVGTTDIPISQQFSTAALDKAAKEFNKLSNIRGQWLDEFEIGKYLKGGIVGKFIREEFEFSNYYKQGNSFRYNKKDIIALSKELKSRNIDLSKYIELRNGQEHLKEKMLAAALNNKVKNKKKSFKVPVGLKDIAISDFEFPDIEIVKNDIKNLMEEFKSEDIESYVDIFGDHAMIKYNHNIKKYLPNRTHTICRAWCNKFNKANFALRLLTEHKQKGE
jgi:hypothetical protein